ADAAVAPRPRARRRLPKRLIAAGVGVAVAVPLVNAVGDWIGSWADPTEPRVVDRSTAPLLLALDDLSEYHAATATLRIDIDREIDTPWVPSVISGERVTFQATGTADAYVDFENLDDDAVTLSPDGNMATIVLPAPELAEVRLDPENSRVVDRDRGLVQRIGGAIGENPTDDTELYALAEDKLAAAAAQSDVLERAENNTRDMLTTLATSLGVEPVPVEFEEPADSGA
ncbi:MAG TPA: DUF4230 domain-containing protein, partial [Nocardioides sp.]|nr:DUF4230 domain-containing protein [Nocardioides sp.]